MSYSALVRHDQIEVFKRSWPCSGIDDKVWSIWFQWDDSGDLIDILAKARNGRQLSSDTYDGPAVVALCADAQRTMHPEHCDARGI